MGPRCDCCRERVTELNRQVSVMRKELKNLRQTLDSGIRAHRKHMTSIRSAVSEGGLRPPGGAPTAPAPPTPASAPAALEQGNIRTEPIGYISSCFSVKNGTPRQPTICGPSRAELRIQQTVFNNPEHALVGLEQYSHVWVIFLFHKNGRLSYKAKVQPPRLNGQRVGVYSTRSPHRPNALGLTLARLDRVIGDTLYLSDIDMIAGTPVLDIKPYIPEYDSPLTRIDRDSNESNTDETAATAASGGDELTLREGSDCDECECSPEGGGPDLKTQSEPDGLHEDSSVGGQESASTRLLKVLEEVEAYVTQGDLCQPSGETRPGETRPGVPDGPVPRPPESPVERPRFGPDAYSTIAQWVREPPVSSLEVRFTPRAERELAEFLPSTSEPPETEADRPRFKFLRSSEEAAAAVRGVLSADPRSVYRRTRCRDRLFFFTLDTADITCWFGHDFVEVLQVRPVQEHVALL